MCTSLSTSLLSTEETLNNGMTTTALAWDGFFHFSPLSVALDDYIEYYFCNFLSFYSANGITADAFLTQIVVLVCNNHNSRQKNRNTFL